MQNHIQLDDQFRDLTQSLECFHALRKIMSATGLAADADTQAMATIAVDASLESHGFDPNDVGAFSQESDEPGFWGHITKAVRYVIDKIVKAFKWLLETIQRLWRTADGKGKILRSRLDATTTAFDSASRDRVFNRALATPRLTATSIWQKLETNGKVEPAQLSLQTGLVASLLADLNVYVRNNASRLGTITPQNIPARIKDENVLTYLGFEPFRGVSAPLSADLRKAHSLKAFTGKQSSALPGSMVLVSLETKSVSVDNRVLLLELPEKKTRLTEAFSRELVLLNENEIRRLLILTRGLINQYSESFGAYRDIEKSLNGVIRSFEGLSDESDTTADSIKVVGTAAVALARGLLDIQDSYSDYVNRTALAQLTLIDQSIDQYVKESKGK